MKTIDELGHQLQANPPGEAPTVEWVTARAQMYKRTRRAKRLALFAVPIGLVAVVLGLFEGADPKSDLVEAGTDSAVAEQPLASDDVADTSEISMPEVTPRDFSMDVPLSEAISRPPGLTQATAFEGIVAGSTRGGIDITEASGAEVIVHKEGDHLALRVSGDDGGHCIVYISELQGVGVSCVSDSDMDQHGLYVARYGLDAPGSVVGIAPIGAKGISDENGEIVPLSPSGAVIIYRAPSPNLDRLPPSVGWVMDSGHTRPLGGGDGSPPPINR